MDKSILKLTPAFRRVSFGDRFEDKSGIILEHISDGKLAWCKNCGERIGVINNKVAIAFGGTRFEITELEFHAREFEEVREDELTRALRILGESIEYGAGG